jgi:hypothetical protein
MAGTGKEVHCIGARRPDMGRKPNFIGTSSGAFTIAAGFIELFLS